MRKFNATVMRAILQQRNLLSLRVGLVVYHAGLSHRGTMQLVPCAREG